MIYNIRKILIISMLFTGLELKAQTKCSFFLGDAIPVGVSINGRHIMVNDGQSSWSFDSDLRELSKKLSSIHLLSGTLSQNKQTIAVYLRGSADNSTSNLIVLFSKQGKKLNTIKLNRGGGDVFWPENNPSVLIVPFYESHYISDWFLDTRLDQERVTVGSDLIDVSTGELKGTITHGLGWNRYKALAWPSEKYYVPQYKIYWSRTGKFYADIEGDNIDIYEVNTSTMEKELVTSKSLKALKEKFKNTLGLFADDLTKFERELAESLKL